MSNENEDTTSTTTSTTEHELTPQEQEAQHVGPNPTPANAAPTTDLNASGSVASPAVAEPADDPTTNDVEQTNEDRLAEARQTAMDNHAAANGQDRADQSSRSEEEVA